MIRHPDNTNLTLHYEATYSGFPVQVEKGPFITEYLARLYQTMMRALTQYSRVFAFRVDFRLPSGIHFPEGEWLNAVIGRALESFKAKIEHNRRMARRENKYAHDSCVRYFWARERGQKGRPHYHVVIFLNYDAFNGLGVYLPGRDNIFNRIQEAWSSALGMSVEEINGLVEFPSNPYYRLDRGNWESLARFFYRASYLCKAATKCFGDGSHGVGSSRT